MGHVTVLGGGLETAKFLTGLVEVFPEERIRVVVNVGDDDETWGLHVSPDVDCILYALAGELDPARNWRRRGETFQSCDGARRLGLRSNRKIGDRDLATHLLRTQLLRSGSSLEEATRELTERFGVGVSILPATNQRVRTRVLTQGGAMSVADFYANPAATVLSVCYEGAEDAQALSTAIDAIMTASRVILAPADPVRCMDAILAVPGIRDALGRTPAAVIGVSPVVGTHLPGNNGARFEPLMRVAGGAPVSAQTVAQRYGDFLDQFVIHTSDLSLLEAIRKAGPRVWVENIVVAGPDDAARLARRVVNEERPVRR